MKKKIVIGILCAALAASMAACGGKDTASSSAAESAVTESGASSTSNEVASTSEGTASELTEEEKAVMEIPVVDGTDWKLEDCIELGEYKNLELTKTVQAVSDDEVESSMNQQFVAEEVTDENAAVQDGDTVNIAFEGKKDGVAFDGGTSDSYDLVIGSGSFIDGFEDGLIGMKKGETKDLNLTFPENYSSADLAGQDVVFTVTINKISRLPEITDEYVSKFTDGQYKTVDEYREQVRESLQTQNDSDAENDLEAQAWNLLQKNSTFKALPQQYIDDGKTIYETRLSQTATQYGVDVDTFLQQSGVSNAQYEQDKELYARSSIAELYLLIDALAKAENITEDSDEYQTKLDAVAEGAGSNADTLIAAYGEDAVRETVMMGLVMDKVIGYANITEAEAESTNG
ncbi:MAG: trigger factor [Eubacterium sp.]|nr:trigger factor [Eubacterium sp.]